MSDIGIFPIPAFNDNYIWCIHNHTDCWVVDPGDAAPVFAHLQANNLTLRGILVTHHHWDHTNGIGLLKERFANIPVYGPDSAKIDALSDIFHEGDQVRLAELNLTFEIIEVPGHTLDHIAFYGHGMLFCGDTLFSAGCGRLFEGTPKQMYHSLQKLMQLPSQTIVYCTHEYTMANLTFARQVEPDNKQLNAYYQWAEKQRRQGLVTLPSSIEKEKAINPFLRSEQHGIKHNAEQYVGRQLPNEEAVFAAVRQWKDNF